MLISGLAIVWAAKQSLCKALVGQQGSCSVRTRVCFPLSVCLQVRNDEIKCINEIVNMLNECINGEEQM